MAADSSTRYRHIVGWMQPFRTRYRELRSSLGPYSTVARQLLRDSLSRFKVLSVTIVSAGLAGVALQGAALLVALRYARLLEGGASFSIFGRVYAARASLEMLLAFSIVAVVLLLTAGVLTYVSESKILTLRRRYEVFCADRVLMLLSGARWVWAPADRPFSDDRFLLKVARSDARYCGRVLGLLVQLVVPAATVVGALGIMFYLNPTVSAVLVLLMGLSALFLYRVNRSAARASQQMEVFSSQSSQEYKRLLKWIMKSSFPLPDRDPWMLGGLWKSGATKRYLDAYEHRLRAGEQAVLLSNVVFGVALLLLLLSFGGTLLRTGQGWGELLAYLVVMQRGMSNFRQGNKKVAALNRFYPQLKRQFAFVNAMTASRSRIGPELPATITLTADLPRIEGSIGSSQHSVRCRIAIIAPVRVDRYSLAVIVDSAFGNNTEQSEAVLNSAAVVTAEYELLPGRPFRESVGLPPEYSDHHVKEKLVAMGLPKASCSQLPALDGPVQPEHWNALTRDIKFALGMLATQWTTPGWVFIDASGLRTLRGTGPETSLEQLSGCSVAIVYGPEALESGSHGEEVVAVVDGSSTRGLGSWEWLRGQQEPAKAALQNGPLGNFVRASGSMPYDDDDEEDDDD